MKNSSIRSYPAFLLLCFFTTCVNASEVIFSDQILITGHTGGANSVFSIDVDGDGDNDVISGSVYGEKIAWFENLDGAGNFGSINTISTSVEELECIFSADLDGDGDNDVLSASSDDNKIAWYENIDGSGNFGPQQLISWPVAGASSVFSIDIDGDGDNDVISAGDGDETIAWYENLDGTGNFGAAQSLETDTPYATSVFSRDMDGDGDNDILIAGLSNGSTIAWYENTDGLGNFGPQQVITNWAVSVKSVFSVDLDGDGDNDVLAASSGDDQVTWYENLDGEGEFDGYENVISYDADGASCVYSIDIDGDGDNDVLSASYSDDKISLYENTDGSGNFGPQINITTGANGAKSVFCADIGGDGDPDVLSASYSDSKIAWYENADGLGSFNSQYIIIGNAPYPRSVFSIDLDGDNDNDILSASAGDHKIAWYENTDGLGTFYQHWITSDAQGASSVFSIDIDNDGDNDVLSSSEIDNKIAWYENIDGMGNFSQEQIITSNAFGARCVFSADIDGDEDNDVLSASDNWIVGEEDKIAWYENLDGSGDFGPEQEIYFSSSARPRSVFCADLDQDGDSDVVCAPCHHSSIAWFENLDGHGIFGPISYLTTDLFNPTSVFCTDLDNDEDIDVISSSKYSIAWFEQANGYICAEQIVTREADDAECVFCADIDGDGDNDVLSASGFGYEMEDQKIAWNDNLNGEGYEWQQYLISNDAYRPTSIFSADLDGDGDYDVISASSGGIIAWYRNEGLVGVNENNFSTVIPESFEICSVYPNPFNPTTTIEIGLPVSSYLTVSIYNMLGQEVASLFSGHQQTGFHSFTFDGSDHASGIYFARAAVKGKMDVVRKIVFLK